MVTILNSKKCRRNFLFKNSYRVLRTQSVTIPFNSTFDKSLLCRIKHFFRFIMHKTNRQQAGRHTSQSTVPYWSATAFYLSSIITNNHFRKKWLWTIDWKRNHFIEDIKRRENNMQVGTLLKRMNQSSIAVKCTESKSLTANRANENNSQKLNE